MSKSIEGVQVMVKVLININRDPELYNELSGLGERRAMAGRLRALSNIGLERTRLLPLKQNDEPMDRQKMMSKDEQSRENITKISEKEKGLFDAFRSR